MKNFRKVLALILVVATLFSFVAMASAKSATEYTDYADVKYVEAVDVLTALGIINGYDGAFHPADTIDRDEMAKMIAVLRNAGDFDADLYATANKFADVKGQWAEGYVAYCAQLGIIAGYNATTFAPDAAVKAVEVAKMLLCTLGFNAEKQGYVGANWEVAVIRDATKYGIIPADVNPYEAATRDDAAQMFLNALQAPMVAGYISENVFTATNSLYGKYAEGAVDFSNISLKEAEKNVAAGAWELAYGNAVVSNKALWTIYGIIADCKADAIDCYGRPAVKWTIKSGYTTLLEKVYTKTAAKYYTDTTTLATDFTAYLKDGYKVAVRVNGGDPTVYSAADVLANVVTIGGKGIESWVYIDTVQKFINVFSKDVYIAKVTAVNPFYGTFTLSDGCTFAQPATPVAVDDIVLVYLCNGGLNHAAPNACSAHGEKLHEVTVVEPVAATVTAGQISGVYGSWFVADGKTYAYNANFGLKLAGNNEPADKLEHADAGKYWIYTDKFGNAMYVEEYSLASAEYAYVVEGTAKHVYNGYSVDAITGVATDCVDTADLVKFTGVNDSTLAPANAAVEHDIVTLMAQTAGNAYGATNPSLKRGIGRLVKIGTDDAGLYTQTAATFAPAGTKLTKGSNAIYTANGLASDIYMDTATKIMVRTQAADGTYSYKEYVGYNNLPATYIAETVTLNGETLGTNIQYFTKTSVTGTKIATYIFIDAKYTPAAATRFFNMGETAVASAFNVAYDGFYANDYVIYRALVDGVDSFVALDKNATALVKNYMYTGMVEYIGSAIDFQGVTLPLYRATSKVEYDYAGDPIGTQVGVYIDANGVAQVQIKSTVNGADATGRLYPVVEGFKVITIVEPDTENPNTFTGYYVEDLAAMSELSIENAYVIWNADKTAVAAIYRIAGSAPVAE